MISTGYVILIVAAAVVLSVVFSGVYYHNKILGKITYMLDALEDKELNFRFDESHLHNRRLHKTLNRIRVIFEKEKEEIAEHEKYYARMLDQVTTGIVVVDREAKREGRVIYCNASALAMLGMSTFSQTRQLGNISPELENCFRLSGPALNDMRVSIYNEKGKTTLSVTNTETSLQGKSVSIFALNDITNEMAHNEELSWNRLIRVLTHEIMNTITPISSLSHTLSVELEETSPDAPVNRKELKLGLDTISDSSKGLIKFVDTYRSLTRISAPQKKAFFLRDLVERVRKLSHEQLLSSNADFAYKEMSDDILLYADEDQLSQVFINLVRNALQAGATSIVIQSEIDFAGSTVVTVSNNGKPIGKDKHDEIFVPFYTTKQDGTGIGLSISRQIMRMHNGSISLQESNEERTSFLLCFR